MIFKRIESDNPYKHPYGDLCAMCVFDKFLKGKFGEPKMLTTAALKKTKELINDVELAKKGQHSFFMTQVKERHPNAGPEAIISYLQSIETKLKIRLLIEMSRTKE
jgi:hypothetical protein